MWQMSVVWFERFLLLWLDDVDVVGLIGVVVVVNCIVLY